MKQPSEHFTRLGLRPAEPTTARLDFVGPIASRRLSSIRRATTSRRIGGLSESSAPRFRDLAPLSVRHPGLLQALPSAGIERPLAAVRHLDRVRRYPVAHPPAPCQHLVALNADKRLGRRG